MLPITSFEDQVWKSVGGELWPLVARVLGAQRLARQVRCKTSLVLHSFFVAFPRERYFQFIGYIEKRSWLELRLSAGTLSS